MTTVASQSSVARFLYERGLKEIGAGTPWAQLTVGQRDRLVDLVGPIVPILERLVTDLKEISEEVDA